MDSLGSESVKLSMMNMRLSREADVDGGVVRNGEKGKKNSSSLKLCILRINSCGAVSLSGGFRLNSPDLTSRSRAAVAEDSVSFLGTRRPGSGSGLA